MTVKSDLPMSWTRRSVAVSLQEAVEEHRRQTAQRLIAFREARSWSQEDLAYNSKVTIRTISRLENGTTEARRGTIRALAAALGVNEVDILGTPPAPLGLGGLEVVGRSTQLDRIEALLLEVLNRLPEPADDAPEIEESHPPGPGPPDRSATARALMLPLSVSSYSTRGGTSG